MSIDDILDFMAGLDGVLTWRPGPGDGSPEIAWGDVFFFFAPDGTVPQTTQPFATVVTKDYPGDASSRLDRPGAFRVNIAAGRAAFVRVTGHESGVPVGDTDDGDPGAADVVTAHPVYGVAGWLAVVDPGPRTAGTVRQLLGEANGLARARYERRAGAQGQAGGETDPKL